MRTESRYRVLRTASRRRPSKTACRYRTLRMVSRYRTLKAALADFGVILGSGGSIVLGVGGFEVRDWDFWNVLLAYDDHEGER